MNEIWKQHESYPKYEISNYGEVRNKRFHRLIEPIYSRKDDDMQVYLCNTHNKYVYVSLKRLVAETFNGGPHDDCEVIKLDDDFYNHHSDNLAWVKKEDIDD